MSVFPATVYVTTVSAQDNLRTGGFVCLANDFSAA